MTQNISTVCFRLLQSSNLKLSWFIGKLELRELNCFFKKIRIRNVERWWFYIKFLRKAFATFLEASGENWREKILDLNKNIGTADGDESSVVYQCSPSWHLLVQRQQRKHQSNAGNLFTNKETSLTWFVFILNFEHIWHIILVLTLLTLNK